MNIYFIRHGQTEDNIRGIIQGQLDTPLNDTGRQQARLLAARLKNVKFDEAWSSSLSRASETARIVLTKDVDISLNTHPGLMERHLGSLQGRRRRKGEPLPNDVESSSDFRNRVTGWFLSFISSHALPSQGSNKDKNILIMSHGAYLTALISILLQPPFSFFIARNVDVRQSCYNTSIMKVHLNPKRLPGTQGKWETKLKVEWEGIVESWADIKHLDEESEDVGVADNVS